MRIWLDRFVVGCLYTVLLMPLIFQQALMHPLVIAKTLFFQVIVELALAAYITLIVFYKEYRPRITPLFIGVISLFATVIISGVFAANPVRSIWSVPERMTGIVLMAHLVAYFVLLSGMRQSFSWRRYLSVSVAVSFLTALFPVIQLIFPTIFFDKLGDRLSGTIGNPIFLSAYLFFHVFLAGWLAEKTRAEKDRWWPYALIGVFNLIVIMLTQTRGALVAIAVSAGVLSLYLIFTHDSGRRTRIFVYTAWACAVIFAGVFWITREASVWRGVPVLSRIAQEGFRANNRLIAWNVGISTFMEYPVTGIGWDNFYAGFNAHYDPRLLRGGFTETFFDRPHNVFVQFLAETGVLGFAAYGVLLGIAFYQARKNKWIAGLLVAYVAQNFFAFDSVSNYVIFFAMLAFINAEYGDSSRDVLSVASRHGNASRGVLILVACGIAATFCIYFFNYRLYVASHLEWTSVNHFVHGEIPEGIEYMDKALAASTPYHVYIAKDLYPNIALLYQQNLPLPDVRNLVERAVQGMRAAAEAEPLNYGFWIGLADMTQPIAALDPKYVDEGLTALSRADAISPRRQATEYVRAKLLNLKGDKAGALLAMERAIALDPVVGDAHFYYALLLLESGDVASGVRELSRATELGREPRSAREASVAAAQLGDLGMYKESALYFQKALLMQPDDLELTMKLGLVYYFDGNKDAARRLILEVMKKQDLKQSPQYQSLLPVLSDLGLLK